MTHPEQPVPSPPPAAAGAVDFDEFARSYDEDLARGISVSGESKDYFAKKRVDWTARRLAFLGPPPATLLDFGCGTGGSVDYLLSWPGVQRLTGVDPSAASLAIARRDHADARADYRLPDSPPPTGVDLAYTNGTFHHITATERPAALRYVFDTLRPGGIFVMWENNPLNPGTRLVMSRCAFDRDAEPFTARSARAQLRAAGFSVVRTDHLFIFPRVLRALRPTERWLSGLPLGAQYAVFARRPGGPSRPGDTPE